MFQLQTDDAVWRYRQLSDGYEAWMKDRSLPQVWTEVSDQLPETKVIPSDQVSTENVFSNEMPPLESVGI